MGELASAGSEPRRRRRCRRPTRRATIPRVRRAEVRHSVAALALLACAPAGCGDLPPRGEVVVVVDTDLPAPAFASRLRVDLYTKEGAWYESRTVARPNANDWPLSFGIRSPEDRPDAEVLVRLRVHPEGKVRSYLGERIVPPVTFSPPVVAKSFAELCSGAAKLELGASVRVRRGFWPIFDTACAAQPSTSGSAAVYVDVAEAGTYRFAITSADLGEAASSDFVVQASLDIRAACDLGAESLACDEGVGPSGPRLPDLTVDLEPGRYFALTSSSGFADGPADLVVAAARADGFDAVSPPPSTEPPTAEIVPKLLRDDAAATPDVEPLPDLTVDRLVRIPVPPERTSSTTVILRGACTGTQATLPLTPGSEPATCVAEEGVLVPVADAELADGAPALPASLVGTFGNDEPCDAQGSTADVVCVPGGWFVLGGEAGAGFGEASSVPERLATLPRFWIDRHEVTVGRYQAALAAGFPQLPGKLAVAHDPGCSLGDPELGPDYALTCALWYDAEAFCEFEGGRLPTEAEWEYVATRAGREEETLFAWGSSPPECACTLAAPGCNCAPDDPGCHFAVVARDPDNLAGAAQCIVDLQDETIGPLPVAASGGPNGDVTPLGVVGLIGGVSEVLLDADHPYDGACWRGTRIGDRVCREDEALGRMIRGGGFLTSLGQTAAVIRFRGDRPGLHYKGVGFRCVYPTRPAGGSAPR